MARTHFIHRREMRSSEKGRWQGAPRGQRPFSDEPEGSGLFGRLVLHPKQEKLALTPMDEMRSRETSSICFLPPFSPHPPSPDGPSPMPMVSLVGQYFSLPRLTRKFLREHMRLAAFLHAAPALNKWRINAAGMLS